MGLINQPFESTRLEEERAKDKRKTFTVSMNDQELKELEEVKLALDLKSNGVALKLMAEMGKKVLFDTLDSKTWYWLIRKNRSRYSDFKDIERKIGENVTQKYDEM